ncbi:MAG TPA: hypothetical protein PLG47_03285 [Candidatus Dojkabacteria bacterium]|nr:hypothetical protein [Candidatus Dojkabacteria bacterium]
MGRYSTGAMVTSEVIRIELPYLIRKKLIQKGCQKQFTLSWTNGSNITVISNYIGNDISIRLIYCTTFHNTGEKKDYDYKINLTTIPSNLGRGEILYFVCPSTGRKARILYKCYGSEIWKSRFAYRKRIYYQSQISSKLNFHNDSFWNLTSLLNKIEADKRKKTYKGKPTRIYKRIISIKEKIEKHEWLRWEYLPKAVMKDLNRMGITAKEFY